jgi:uncharacterized protein involved in exopolysaccharide biosynthesis
MASAKEEIVSEDKRLVDYKLISNLVGYVVGSIGRHKLLAPSLCTGIFVASVSLLYLLPGTYHVESKLLARPVAALSVRGDNNPNDSPTRSAVETVKRRDNLVALVRQTDLVHQWYKRRAPLPHLEDMIVQALFKPETEHDTIEWIADLLDKKLDVWTAGEGIIQIGIDWPDPTMAFRLVDAAQQNYLEARQASEITAIAEQVSILQNHATTLRADIDTAVEAIEKVRADRLARPAPTATASAAASPSASANPPSRQGPVMLAASPPRRPLEPDPELAQLKVAIEAKRRAINDLEEFRRRRLSELNASLAEKRAMYTDNHPTTIDLRQTIASLSTESPQVQALRADVDRLQKDFDQKSAAAAAESRPVPVIGVGGPPVGAPPPLPGSIIRIERESADERDPAMMYARNQLQNAMEKYSRLRAQIETAQIDFDTAEAAFKYRYTVIDPPVEPKKPSKPNAVAVTLAGLVGGLVVAIFAAVAADVSRGRFVARWQVESVLDLPTLGEIDSITLAEHKIE